MITTSTLLGHLYHHLALSATRLEGAQGVWHTRKLEHMPDVRCRELQCHHIVYQRLQLVQTICSTALKRLVEFSGERIGVGVARDSHEEKAYSAVCR